jgi:hypothetical protein
MTHEILEGWLRVPARHPNLRSGDELIAPGLGASELRLFDAGRRRALVIARSRGGNDPGNCSSGLHWPSA